jgi:hypothetical protein
MTNLNWVLDDAVEIELPDADSFLKIKETLQRIGIPSYKTKTLYQTAHILHKRGKYYIIHFKCLFSLDGKPAPFDEQDWKRQNAIAKLLEDWGLCTMVYELEPENTEDPRNIKIIKFSEKKDWTLVSKYNIGE